MAIAPDNASTVGESLFGDTATTTFTVGSLTNGILNIFVACDSAGTLATPTVGGSATGVTRVGTTRAPSGGFQIDWYRLMAPSAGANVLSVTCAGASFVSIAGTSYSGVDQTVPFGGPATANGADAGPATVNVSTTTGDLVLDALGFDPGGGTRTVTAGGGQTQRENNSGNGSGLGASEETAAGATTTMSWTLSAPAEWAIVAAIMNPAGGGDTSTTAQRMAAVSSHAAAGGMHGRWWR